ncbi:MBL fold metallo-hydrolase [Hyperthermus butylicus]|uniref:MBL fold metallo-hydrolase n=1 Tax=Hyperthermus butylicus TaxID=54248 RepID=UPI00068EB193|nr:MBL fold metallo-hydrolase [Hyperthermus butylicus]
MRVELVWFDSLGAKGASVLVEACGHRVVIDPGVAVMHPSFPASREAKEEWYREGLGRVMEALKRADIVVVTHYHHDHYLYRPEHISLYLGKTLYAKNPNIYVNESQHERALEFYSMLYRLAGIGDHLEEPALDPNDIPDPLDSLLEARSRSFPGYDKRRRELLERGRGWFKRLVGRWASWRWIRSLEANGLHVVWADGEVFEHGCLRLRFTGPLFHGVEYTRVGWVIGVIVEAGRRRLFYSSDVNGPVIEDYASMIIEAAPDTLILDGPPTYLLGYMLNRVNLSRAIENAVRIVSETTRLETVVYDHHLAREPRFRERAAPVWEVAKRRGVKLATAAEHMGLVPAVLRRA